MADLTPPFLEIECEPWPEDGDLHLWSADDDSDEGIHIATVSGDMGIERRNATAKRIAALWNANLGVSTRQLEIVANYANDEARLSWLGWAADQASRGQGLPDQSEPSSPSRLTAQGRHPSNSPFAMQRT